MPETSPFMLALQVDFFVFTLTVIWPCAPGARLRKVQVFVVPGSASVYVIND